MGDLTADERRKQVDMQVRAADLGALMKRKLDGMPVSIGATKSH